MATRRSTAKPKQPRRGAPGAREATAQRKEQFCVEYVIDKNGTRAALAVGYSPKAAGSQASRLLKDANVRTRIAELERLALQRAGVTKDRVTRELEKIAFSDIGDVFETDPVTQMPRLKPIEDWPAAARQAIAGVKTKHVDPVLNKDGVIVVEGFTTVEIKFYDKPAALVKLGTDLGMFVQRHRHAGIVKLEQLTPEERLERIAAITAQARARRDGTPSPEAAH